MAGSVALAKLVCCVCVFMCVCMFVCVAKAALLVTRSALSAFSVTNRRDVYVLQDVSATGEENIFYVK